jgi:hypothetical protein
MSPASGWPKRCRCGEEWSREHWPELPLSGRYLAGRDGWIELRTCVCGSTMSIEIGDAPQKTKPSGEADGDGDEPTERPAAS